MKKLLLISSLALAATVWAQEPAEKSEPAENTKPAAKVDADAEAWVKRLGADSYDVREEATKKLIAMGAKAVPALENALRSDDLEVRLRAGRALRAIRGDAERANGGRDSGPMGGDKPKPRRGFEILPGRANSGVQVQMMPGKVKVTVTETKDGKVEKKVYEGKSIEELKKKHPELRGKLGNFRFRMGPARTGRDPFDIDRFMKDLWNNDDDLQREMREIQDLINRMRKANREAFGRGWDMRNRFGRPMNALLGVRVTKPSPVLDAQLGLRGRGLVIEVVEKGSLADRLGLEKYDILLSLNGQALRHANDVYGVLKTMDRGAELKARVMRTGESKDLKATR